MNAVRRRFVFNGALLLATIMGCRSVSNLVPPGAPFHSTAPIGTPAPAAQPPPPFRSVAYARLPNPRIGVQGQAPLLLSELTQIALSTSPDLQAYCERIAIAESTLSRARAELYPTLNLVEQYAASNNPANAFSFQLNQAQFDLSKDVNHPGTIDNFQSRLRLEHRIYAGRQRLALENSADALQSAATYDLAAARNQLVFAVAEAYYRLLQARDLVAICNDAVAQVEEHLRIAQARFDAQTAMRSDVLTVEVRLAEVREAQIAAENRLTLAWAVLRNVTGADIPPQPLPEDVPAAPWTARVANLQQSLGEAICSRPEIMALNSRGAAAGEDVQAARAGKKPALDVIADYDVFSGDLSSANDSYFLGLILQWNLFDAGRTASDVQRAQAYLRELRAQQQRLVLDIELDVQQSFLQLRDAQERLKVTEHAIERAQQNLLEIECRYRNEMATITELIDAQVGFSNARARRATAAAELQIATLSLQRASGYLCAACDDFAVTSAATSRYPAH